MPSYNSCNRTTNFCFNLLLLTHHASALTNKIWSTINGSKFKAMLIKQTN